MTGSTVAVEYEERRVGHRRRFRIHDDAVLVESWGAFGIRQGSETIRLVDLKPDVQRVWVKDGYRHNVVFLVTALLALSIVGVLFLARPLGPTPWPQAMGSVVLLMLGSLAFAAMDPYRVEFACFKYSSGVVALVVGRLGTQREGFEAFVEAVAGRVSTLATAASLRSNRGAAQQGVEADEA